MESDSAWVEDLFARELYCDFTRCDLVSFFFHARDEVHIFGDFNEVLVKELVFLFFVLLRNVQTFGDITGGKPTIPDEITRYVIAYVFVARCVRPWRADIIPGLYEVFDARSCHDPIVLDDDDFFSACVLQGLPELSAFQDSIICINVKVSGIESRVIF